VLSGIDGVLLIVVIGDGKLVVPVDFAIRRPDPPTPASQSYPRLLLEISIVLMLCWLCRLEFYPFTGMQMFSAYDPSGIVTYDKVLAHYAAGTVARAPIEHCFGAMADSRYRRLLALVWEEGQQPVCQAFFQTCGRRWNQQAGSSDAIVQFEVQRWQWNFLAQPHDLTHGHLLARRVYTVQ
jgi:hypothetical protein